MSIMYEDNLIVLSDICTVDDAEILLECLHKYPDAKLDIKNVTHIHTAVLQVLVVSSRLVISLPEDKLLYSWLSPVLNTAAKK